MSSNKKPLVSYVIRTKDEEKYIGKVLEAIKAQTYKHIEIIIVDSGSVDKTLQIARKYPTKILNIKQKDFNFSYALNLGINKAKGKYVCILSGHSIPISDTWLEDGISNFNNKKVAGVSGYYNEIFPFGYYYRPLGKLGVIFMKKREEYDEWMTNTNALIKKDFWRIYPFDEKLSGSEDHDWAKEMISRGYNIVKDVKFSVIHSHLLVNKPNILLRKRKWRKREVVIDKRKRPRKSYTKLEMH